jgi:nitroimidazol reductase NimA-like FMN-containing flavoprotein (pyridoxamine 5'-phosphate oxidase superfamily)
MDGSARYEDLRLDECWALLPLEPVGRIGLNIDALPTVLPVNFAILEGAIVFRTAASTKLEAATSGTVIAFEVDHYDREGRQAWSVLVRGIAEEILEPGELARAQALSLESWALESRALDGAKARYVRIPATVVTGRAIRR